MSDLMKSIISDVRHSADVDKYTKEQRQFLWSIADRLEAARESEGGEVVGTAMPSRTSTGNTIATFDKDRVPAGTKLYSRPIASAPDTDLGSIHMVLRRVWARELSADDALDEIERIVEQESE